MDTHQIPVKQRIFDDLRRHSDNRGRVSLSPDAIAKRYGLNGHDLVKNLDQLRTQGLIELSWANERIQKIRVRKGALNEAIIAEANQSAVDKLTEAINMLPWENGYRVWDPSNVQRLSGLNSRQVTDALAVLRADDKIIQFGGGTRGKRISGVRWKGEAAPNGPTATQVPPVRTASPATPGVILPPTPHLDQYIAARRIATLAPSENPYLAITFERDPLAEEAILLRDRLTEALRR